MEVKEVISFLENATERTYSSQDKYYLSKAIDTLCHMKDCGCFNYINN